ncbi:MAG: hypothetical protein DRP08_08190, partial [Candidatus Aenigmatarchaeota archaeon]
MDIKKLLAGGLAAITAGATIALGAVAITDLGDYMRDPAVTNGKLNSPIIVIGDSVPAGGLSQADVVAREKDVLGAADIAAAVAGYATQTVSTGAGANVVVSGGADVATADNKLYMNSVLNKARDTLTASDLSTLLAKGTVTVSGTDYDYDQYITLGSNPSVTYNTITAANILDPVVHLSVSSGSTTANVIYNASVVFNKPLNISDSKTQGKKLTLFGKDYTIGAGSGATNLNYNPLILYGYGVTETLTLDNPVTVTIGGTEYTVEATYIGTVGTTATLLLEVNGLTSDSLNEGDSDVISGLNVYVKSILPASVAGQTAMAVVSLGSEKLTLTDGEAVTLGASTPVDGTLVDLVGDTNGLSKITVSVAAEDSTKEYIAEGAANAFVDPVFGSFKVAFNGLTPNLTDSARDTVTISAGNTQVSVTLTDYRGNEKTINFARIDSNNHIYLNTSATQDIVVIEGQTIHRNDLFVFAPEQESEFGHILKLALISGVDGSNPRFKIEDVVTGASTTYNIDKTDGVTDIYIDGQLIQVTNQTESVTLSWGDTDKVAFPLIKLAGGEYLAFIDNRTALSLNTVYELPENATANVSTADVAA